MQPYLRYQDEDYALECTNCGAAWDYDLYETCSEFDYCPCCGQRLGECDRQDYGEDPGRAFPAVFPLPKFPSVRGMA